MSAEQIRAQDAAVAAATAYDRIAGEYDQQVRGSQWMREVLWARYQRLFKPGQRVLDLSCGTGIDALYLARRGVQVLGIDASNGMIAQLEAKARRLGLAGRVQACVGDLNALPDWPAQFDGVPSNGVPFDGALSAFAGLSTLPDISTLSAEVARRLKPGGVFIVHMLNRFCLWTFIEHVRHGHLAEALRQGQQRQGLQTTLMVDIGGIPVRHYLYFPGEAYHRFFERHFVLRRTYGLGCLRPANTPDGWSNAHLATLGGLETNLAGHFPFSHAGLFFVLEMRKRTSQQDER